MTVGTVGLQRDEVVKDLRDVTAGILGRGVLVASWGLRRTAERAREMSVRKGQESTGKREAGRERCQYIHIKHPL